MMDLLVKITASVSANAIIWFARFITAVRGTWVNITPSRRKRVYFANHTSNGDFILLWTVLPAHIRKTTRPVAAADYWITSKLKTFIGRHVVKAVLIDRNPKTRTEDPIEMILAALDQGSSLILFPEGRRNMTNEKMLPFKPGLFHLAENRPEVELVPCWIENLNRVLPKGEIIPIPFACTVRFGAPMHLQKGEGKQAFLARAEQQVLALSPANGGNDG
jgi:1-acyl-sn-glycerol-3-phosphate acyltransferase